MFIAGEPLQPTATATTIRKENGRPLVLDGPFAETKEQLAGYYILDCAESRRGDRLGRKNPDRDAEGGEGCIEIRPIARHPAAVGRGAEDRCRSRLKSAPRSRRYFAASTAGSSRA